MPAIMPLVLLDYHWLYARIDITTTSRGAIYGFLRRLIGRETDGRLFSFVALGRHLFPLR